MYEVGNIPLFAPRWQGIMPLLTVLSSRRGGWSKQEALSVIADEGWFDIRPEDETAYPSNLERGCREPQWMTGICWGRKDGVENGLLEPKQHNNWTIIARGLDWQELVTRGCKAGTLDVRRCFLWSPAFKRYLHPAYEPGDDARRPITLYDDWYAKQRQAFLDSL